MPEVVLREWETREATRDEHDPLRGRFLDDPAVRAVASRLGPRVRVYDARHGLGIAAEQTVGAFRLGDLDVRIRPKLAVADLWHLVVYALGFDVAALRTPTELALVDGEVVDLLGLLLLHEADLLRRRGLRRRYRETHGLCAAPRGRIDVAAVACAPPRPELPCAWSEATTDTPDHRIVRAALRHARREARGPVVAARLAAAEASWAQVCSLEPLDGRRLDRVDRERTRLTAHYEPAHRVARWLWEGRMPDPELGSGGEPMPGALWDMAVLFERFVARFLGEHLDGLTVEAQARLPHLYHRVADARGRSLPRPRPDLLVRDGDAIHGVYDTKYRDLWATSLPREMLYQLSVYALGWSREGAPVPATILYPQVGVPRPDVIVGLSPARGSPTRIVVRGVDWAGAGRLIHAGSRAEARALARAWVGAA